MTKICRHFGVTHPYSPIQMNCIFFILVWPSKTKNNQYTSGYGRRDYFYTLIWVIVRFINITFFLVRVRSKGAADSKKEYGTHGGQLSPDQINHKLLVAAVCFMRALTDYLRAWAMLARRAMCH